VFRHVLVGFVGREIKVRYKQTAIGIGWAVLQPIIAAVIFALFLGRLAHVASEGVPYLLFVLSGMVVWTYFSTTLNLAALSLFTNQSLLRKVYFPREILPLYGVLAGLVDLVPGLAVLICVTLLYGVWPTAAWLLLPLPLLIALVTSAGLGILLSALNVYYKDVRYALPFFLQVALFATPVVYSLSVVSEPWRSIYAVLNPMAAAVDGTRSIIAHGDVPDLAITFGALAWSLALLVFGYAQFKRLERSFSDRV
jgi:lipopolysaccharide transport system permease protein